MNRASILLALLLICSCLLGWSIVPGTERTDLGAGMLQAADSASVIVNVTDDASRGIIDAEVRVQGNDTVWHTNSTGAVLVSDLFADANGTEYVFWAGKQGYLNSTDQSITVYPNTTYQITLVLEGGAIFCVVSSSEGPSILGANVTVSALGIYALTAGDGSCTLAGLPSGTHSVNASADGYENKIVGVTVVPGSTVTQAFVLRPMTGTVTGVVSSAEGPLSAATVSISALGMTAITASDGSYSLNGVPVGSHLASARATGYKLDEKLVNVVIGAPVRLDFTLQPLYEGAISGFVLHEGTLDPLSNASVSLRVGDVTFVVHSESNGSYRIPNLAAATYSVTASLVGFNSSTIDNVVVTSGNETKGVDFYLQEKPTRLYGAVKAGAVLLVNVKITVVEANLTSYSSIEGEYEIRNVPAGTYNVTAALEGYITSTVAGVVVPRGTEVPLNINLTGLPGALFGTVLASGSRDPLVGTSVRVVGDMQLIDRSTITNIKGEFEFKGLPEGTYTVVFIKAGYRPLEMSGVEIAVETPQNLTYVLMTPLREDLGGFIFGFDLAHSMMILALFVTIVVLALAVYLRIRTFQAPETAPAVYDQAEEAVAGEEESKEEGARRDEAEGKRKRGKAKV